jgi:triosephosphate isomerase
MSQRSRPLVAGNWKMHKTAAETADFCAALKATVNRPGVDVAVFPTFTGLAAAVSVLEGSAIAVGAQNMHPAESGAFTGEVSAQMLLTIGCSYVIIGHSERRHIFGESDDFCADKVEQAMIAGLQPVLCVGETAQQREAGSTESVVASQLAPAIERLGDPGPLVIAYEPVWAIGTGLTATPEQAEEVHRFIRGELDKRWSTKSSQIRILYGGSVKPDNAGELLSKPNIDGALVGGAALDLESFNLIVEAAN